MDAPTRFITQQEFESLVPPNHGFSLDGDGKGGNVEGPNGSWHISLVNAVHKVPSQSQMFRALAQEANKQKVQNIIVDWKKNIVTDKVTPLITNVYNSYQRITTDVGNLKAQDILDTKKRIENGTATAQDKVYIAELVRQRLDYQINPKHDSRSPTGGANASVLPSNHTELWDKKSFKDAKGNWWSFEGQGKKAVFHRFSSDGNGTYHWNGSTGENVNRAGNKVENSFNIDKVPAEIKKQANYRK